SLLDPEEDAERKILLWSCPDCTHKQEEAADNVTYHKVIQKPSEDKTMPAILPRTRNARCPKCGQCEARFWKARPPGELLVSLFFACCHCTHRWQE
ncbi:hypothetical protein SELMODRAFT_19054, partial [Selaginella moellendorffii]